MRAEEDVLGLWKLIWWGISYRNSRVLVGCIGDQVGDTPSQIVKRTDTPGDVRISGR